MTAQTVPINTYSCDWRHEILEKINGTLDQMEEVMRMDRLDIITKTVFQQKSSILGAITLSFIQKHYAHLINQEYCECPLCKKLLKSRGSQKRTLETTAGTFDLFRPYFYCHRYKIVIYPPG